MRLGLAAALLALAGCSSSAGTSPHPSASVRVPGLPVAIDYVALGDSFTAGPLIVPVAEGSGGCLRSAANYPAVLAELLGVASYVDVSCSGATVRDLTRSQRSFTGGRVAGPQLAAVTRDTDLVTVGIGGNDEGLFASLAGACLRPPPKGTAPSSCARLLSDPGVLRARLASARRVEARLAGVLARIQKRAPDALVVVVGYPQMLPDSGGCRALPIREADLGSVNRVEEALNGALRGAARTAGATYVDLAAASEGHDICAGDQAWVNGAETLLGRAAAFHPFASGMDGAAETIFGALTR